VKLKWQEGIFSKKIVDSANIGESLAVVLESIRSHHDRWCSHAMRPHCGRVENIRSENAVKAMPQFIYECGIRLEWKRWRAGQGEFQFLERRLA
jgi:hypothetical protein